MSDDDYCKHDLPTGTCSICSGRDKPTRRKGARSSGSAESLDTPGALEKYRERYQPSREATFEAYVEVFFRSSGARNFPGGWTMFSRCANAEPKLVETEPKLVERAEELMRAAGYEADDSGRPREGRHWR
jgi:hypothetical protein